MIIDHSVISFVLLCIDEMLEWPSDHLYRNYYRLLTLIRGIKSIGDCSPFSPELADAVETRLAKIESLQRDYPEPKMPSVAVKDVTDSESSSSDNESDENESESDESESEDYDHQLGNNAPSSPLPPPRRKCCCCCCFCWCLSLMLSLVVGVMCLRSICVGGFPPLLEEYFSAKQLLALQPHIPEPVCVELRDLPERLQRIVGDRRDSDV